MTIAPRSSPFSLNPGASPLPHPGHPSHHQVLTGLLEEDIPHRQELLALRSERDPQIFYEALFHLGVRLETEGQPTIAGSIYAAVQQSALPSLAPRAAERLAALRGEGPVLLRAESLGRSLAVHATDPAGIAGMVGAGLLFRMTRLMTLSRLTATPGASFVTRGLGARALANLVGFGLEVPAFTAATRLANAALGREQDWSPRGLGTELAGGAIVLGSLKIFGGIFGSMAQRLPRGRAVLLQGGQLAGILSGHQIEEWLELRPRQDAANWLVEGFGTLIQLHAAGRFVHAVTGERFQKMEREIELRSSGLGSSPVASRWSLGNFENTSHQRPGTRDRPRRAWGTLRDILLSPMWMALGAGGGGFGSIGPRVYSAPEPPSAGPPASRLARLRQALQPTVNQSPYHAEMVRRLELLPESSVHALQETLASEWLRWPARPILSMEDSQRIARLLECYAPLALAHLGRETPAQLPFVLPVFELAVEAYRRSNSGEVSAADRALMLRFLSTQPGRRTAETGEARPSVAPELRPSPRGPAETREWMGNIATEWEGFLRQETEKLSLPFLTRAQVFQRGMALMHFYANYVDAHAGPSGPFRELPFYPDLLARARQDSAGHPYPEASVQLLERFFREVRGSGEAQVPRPHLAPSPGEVGQALPNWNPLPSPSRTFFPNGPGEPWARWLERIGLTREGLDLADLGLAGSTILNWGTERDSRGRLCPPGDILDLLGLVTYLNSGLANTEGRVGIDPLEALRATLPEQWGQFLPEADGTWVIRYPEILRGVDFNHFTLGTLLRAYLHQHGGHDLDLARQWDVSLRTVQEYRRGIIRKMRMELLEQLATGLGSTPETRQEVRNLLLFLRYRPYLEATVPITDAQGVRLNAESPIPSQGRIILAPMGEALRTLDRSRRVLFDQEPIASAMNGTLDLALELLEQRRKEFTLLGQSEIHPLNGTTDDLPGSGIFRMPATVEELSERIRDLRDRHSEFFDLLSRQERAPGLIRPGQVGEMETFYRHFFRFFERIYLHTRPRQVWQLGVNSLAIEIVPPTTELPQGVRLMRDGQDPQRFQVQVVASDLLELMGGRAELPNLLKAQVLLAYLREQGMAWAGARGINPRGGTEPDSRGADRDFVRLFLEREGGLANSGDLLSLLEEVETRTLGWRSHFLDPEYQAVLHRILRGSLAQTPEQRRGFAWQEELGAFVRREGIASLYLPLHEGLEAYLRMVPQPHRGWENARMEDALVSIRDREGEAMATRVREALVRFFQQMGLPTTAALTQAIEFSFQGMAGAAFATYLTRFRARHPLRPYGQLILDPTLLERVLDERLGEAPQLQNARSAILQEMARLIEDYNRRTPPLRTYELAASDEALQEPLLPNPLEGLFHKTLEVWGREHPGDPILPRHLFTALSELRETLKRGEIPESDAIAQALDSAARRLAGLEAIPADALGRQREFFHYFCRQIANTLASFHRLAGTIPDFIQEERFRSGLDSPEKIGQDLSEIFRQHLASALLDPTPLGLRGAILRVIGERFGPYRLIQEDVVRGMQVIHHELIAHWEGQYGQLGYALELSGPEGMTERSLGKFWDSLMILARMHISELSGPAELTQRVEDWERFFPMLNRAPRILVSEDLRSWLSRIGAMDPQGGAPPETPPRSGGASAPPTEVAQTKTPDGPLPEAPAPAIPAVTPHPLPEEWGLRFPELYRVSEEEVAQQANPDRAHLSGPESLPLFHLLALLARAGSQTSHETLQKIGELILDLETSPLPRDQISQNAWDAYLPLRPEVLRNLPVADLVGHLPEIRGSDGPATGEVLWGNLQDLLSRRRMPPSLEREWEHRLNVLAASEQTRQGDENFFSGLLPWYWDNRRAILAAPEIEPPAGGELPLDFHSPLPQFRQIIENEFPELGLVSEAHMKDLSSNRNQNGPLANQGSYLFLNLGAVVFSLEKMETAQSRVMESAQQFLTLWRRLFLAERIGGSIPHLEARGTERALEIYRAHREEILQAILEHMDFSRWEEVLPELREPDLAEVDEPLSAENRARAMTRFLGKINRRILSLSSQTRVRKGLESLLWNQEPAPLTGGMEELGRRTIEMALKLARYYFRHRQEILQGGTSTPSGVNPLSGFGAEPALGDFWEMAVIDRERTGNQQRQLAAAIDLARKNPGRIEFSAMTEDGGLYRIPLPQKEFQEFQRMFEKGRPIPITDPSLSARITLQPQDFLSAIPYHPGLMTRRLLETFLAPEAFEMFRSILRSDNAPAKERMERAFNQGATLLGLGVPREYVLHRLEKALSDLYPQVRAHSLQGMDFRAMVAGLPEIREVPEYAVREGQRRYFGTSPTNPFSANDQELITRVLALMSSGPKAVRSLKIKMEAGDVERTARNVYRPYLENRRLILADLTPWPEVSESVLEEVAAFHEIKDYSGNYGELFQRDAFSSTPEGILLSKLVHFLGAGPLPGTLKEEVRNIIASPPYRSLAAALRVLVNLYREHRGEILRLRGIPPGPKPGNKLLKWIRGGN